MDQDVITQIRTFVRSGFYDADEITEIVCEEMDESGDVDEDEVAACISEAFETLRREQAGWPAQTDCDRLDAAFESLRQQGIIALQNAGYTQSDGYDDVMDIYDAADKDTIVGYCFYHGQDLERAVDGMGLYLAFGPMDAEQEQTEGPRVGRMIADELIARGFAIEWDGTFDQRIFVPAFDWKKRVI